MPDNEVRVVISGRDDSKAAFESAAKEISISCSQSISGSIIELSLNPHWPFS